MAATYLIQRTQNDMSSSIYLMAAADGVDAARGSTSQFAPS